MANILISPGKYLQGQGELGKLGAHAAAYGNKALVLISKSGQGRFGRAVEESFGGTGADFVFEVFGGECSKGEIARLQKLFKDNGCDMVVGVGGGKILDTAKAIAYYEKRPVIICPTIASSDAPCSALTVLYTDEGQFDEYLFLPSNPNLVLMDSAVVAASPIRLTVAGMGDALATYFEARASATSNKAPTCAGGTPTLAALSLAQLCYETLLGQGLKAKLALERGALTKAVEDIIEANTLLSGLGFESGGLAASHAIHNGLTVVEDCHDMYHGEKVAFGVLSQLMLENADAEILEEFVDFCMAVGLPTTLAQLGIKTDVEQKVRAVAKAAVVPTDTAHNMPFAVDEDLVYSAILAADAVGAYYLGE